MRKRHLIAALAMTLPVSLLAQQRTIEGHLHPKAQPRYDRGPAEPHTNLPFITLMLKRSAQQQKELDDLLAAQQDRNSPQYRRWLTPDQFANRFGASAADIERVTAWLKASGFTGARVSRGRDYVTFGGTASQVTHALGTPIHTFEVEGRRHYANVEDPKVPEVLADVVAGFRGLNDFRLHAPKRRALRAVPINPGALTPDFYTTQYPNTNVLAPDDLATIYNVNPLYKAGIDGTGQLLAIAGQTDVDLTDIRYFRKVFNLPANDPLKVLVPGSKNPGISQDDIGEADLDIESAGAIARNATILYVYSTDVFDSAMFVIDQALAPVLSVSYGGCELANSASDIKILEAEAQKAAAEGITWVASSGDSGAAGCEDQNGNTNAATSPLSVNIPASFPEVTGVGGTEFNEGSGNYWASKLGPNGGSALSYIPEGGWTDEASLVRNNDAGFASSGGGASAIFRKPSWQKGAGVPNDGARDVPDVAVTASWFHDPYTLITGGTFVPNGGTSAAAPTFAGIVTLINQAAGGQGLGNMNPQLYQIAQSAPKDFHDVTSGSNIVPCQNGSSNDCNGGAMGYKAHPGYDQVTGLGSVDAYQLARSWGASGSTPHLVVSALTASTKVAVGSAFTLSLTVANQGSADAGAFEMRVYLTSNGDVSTATWYVYCDANSLAAGQTFTCNGTLPLGKSVTPGTYFVVGVADAKEQVQQSDASGGTMLASTGPLVVTK